MENIKLQSQNIMDKYQPTPNLFYDVEGKVVATDGKTINIEKQVGLEVLEYTLNLKEEKDVEVGESVTIDREEINSMKVEKKEEIPQEDIEDIGRILKALGLQDTRANVEMVNKLIKQGVKPTKINIDNYMRNMDSLNKIEENLSLDNLVKVLDKRVDLEDLNITEILDLLENTEKKESKFLDLFKINKDLNYKEAEGISKKIFGQKMGKDVYDIIIVLDREDIEISKENIEKSLEVLNKLSDIKNLETVDYVKVLDRELEFTINNLFKVKNNYTNNKLEENKYAGTIEIGTINKEADYNSVLEVLKMEGIEENIENISLGREFILMDLDIDKNQFEKIKDMKKSIEYINEELTKTEVARLIEVDIDMLNSDINQLREIVKDIKDGEDKENIDKEFLIEIQDKDLLKLLKSGKEFKLSNLKEIVDTDLKDDKSLEFKVFDKITKYTDMLKFIGEKSDFKYIEFKEDISLRNIYEEMSRENPINIKSIEKREMDFLMGEYDKFRENIDSKIIKSSILDKVNLEEISIQDANSYMENRVNKYEKASKLMNEFNIIYKNKDDILPIIINNGLDIDYKSLRGIGEYLGGESGITKIMEIFSKDLDKQDKKSFEDRKNKISDSLKNGDNIGREYIDMMNLMEDGSSNFDKNQDEKNKYFETRNKVSKNDLVVQLPVDIDGFRDLNMIIPNVNQGLDKNHMNFQLSIETKELGKIDMSLEVSGRDIFISEENSALNNYYGLLEERLEKIGYNLVLR